MSDVWTIGRVLGWAAPFLEKHGSESARLDAQLLLGHVCGLDKVQLYVQFERPLGTGELVTFRELIKRRAAGEPVAYILGAKEFYGREFSVDSAVLVPRPETEHLVDRVIAHLKEHEIEAPRIVDVGCGSGAIAVTLAAEVPDAIVVGIDISARALSVASLNAESLGVRDRVKLTRGDVLEPMRAESSVDVVVSNPPYLDANLMATLPKTVRDFEPHLALYGGADGLDVHRRLAAGAARVLKPGGLLAVEMAGEAQSNGLRALWDELRAFGDVVMVRDYAQIPRVLWTVRGS